MPSGSSAAHGARKKSANGSRSGHKRSGAKKKSNKASGFIMDLRYRNELPTPPVDPKFIKIPWRPEKLYAYHISTLEQHYKYRVHLQPVVGAPLHLIDPSTAETPGVRLAEADKHLIRRENDEVTEFYRGGAGGAARSNEVTASTFGNTMSLRNLYESSKIRAGKHWLRKTEYIDNRQVGSIHNYASAAQESKQQLAEIEKERRMLKGNADMRTKAERIEHSFEVCGKLPEHQTNKALKPVRVMSLLPSFDLAKFPLFHVQFFDDNILDDDMVEQSQLDDKGHVRKKRGRNIVDYSERQVKTLEAGILEQVTEEESARISFLVPAEEQVAAAGASADAPLKWVRDYQYNPSETRACENFVMAWDKKTLEAPADANNPVYGTVRFAELEPSKLEMRRNQGDKYDVAASREKRIGIKRRDLTADEQEEAEDRLREIKEGYLLSLDEDKEEPAEEDNDDGDGGDDNDLASAPAKRGQPANGAADPQVDDAPASKRPRKSVNFDDSANKRRRASSVSDSSDNEDEFEPDKKAAAASAKPAASKVEVSDESSSESSGSDD